MSGARPEWHDIRVSGSYYPIGSNKLRTVDRQFRLAGQSDAATGVTTSITNSATSQDVTPTFTQAAAGEAGFNVVSPIAADAYASAVGTHGLEESSDQPGDFTRLFYGTSDTTRAHHLGNHRYGPFNGVNGPGAVTILSSAWLAGTKIVAMTEPGSKQQGFLVKSSNTPTFTYYEWDPANSRFGQKGIAAPPNALPGASFGATVVGASQPTIDMADLVTVRQVANRLWMPDNANLRLVDIFNSGWTIPCPFWVQGYAVLGDRLHCVAPGTGDAIQLVPYDIDATGALARTNDVSSQPIVGTVKNGGRVIGWCVSNGYIILATERALISVTFDDTNKKYVTSLIQDLPTGITGKPVEWGGDVWTPCGNRLHRFTVGKPGNTWMPVDVHGTLPAPYDGDIVQLIPTHDRLVCRIAKDSTRAAALILDGGGAFSTLKWSDNLDNGLTNTAELYTHPMVPIYTRGEPLVAIPRSVAAGTIGVMDTIVVPNGTRNPRGQSAINRQQFSSGVSLWPWQYGQNRLAHKTPARIGVEVEDVGSGVSGLTAKVFIQRDREHASSTQTFGSGPLSGTGLWTPVCEVALESFDIDPTTGAGVLWTELTDAIGNYVKCKSRYRIAAVIGGDVTGVKYPEIRSIVLERYEWVNKGYLTQFRIGLQTEHAVDDGFGWDKFGVYEDEDDLQAAIDDLVALNDHEVIATWWPPAASDDKAFKGVITKYNIDRAQKNDQGLTRAVVTLSVQHVIPAGRYADTLL